MSRYELEDDLIEMLRDRAASVPSPGTPADEVVGRARRRRRHKLIVSSFGAVGALIIVVAVVSAVAPNGDNAVHVAGTTAAPTTPLVYAQPTWKLLPPSPLGPRAGAASAWAGDAFVVWGGRDALGVAHPDGAWYDPATREWHRITGGPLGAPHLFLAGAAPTMPATTGSPRAAIIVNDRHVASFEPRTGTWRSLPDVPIAVPKSFAITDPLGARDLIVTGSDEVGNPSYAVLDTAHAQLSWHAAPLPAVPAGRAAYVNGSLLFWYLDASHTSHGFSITDLQSGRTERLTDPPRAQSTSGSYSGFQPLGVDGSMVIGEQAGVTMEYSLVLRKFVAMRGDAVNPCGNVHLWTGRQLLSWGATDCNGADPRDVLYDAASGEARAVPPVPIVGRTASAWVWSKRQLIIYGGIDASGNALADGAVLTLP